MARDPKYDPLFEPIRIGPKTMKNRFYQVPQCSGAGSDRPGTQAAHRAVKAEGGWGAVCTEACSIDPQVDSDPAVVARLWDDGDVVNLRHMCDAVHRHGALAGTELWHTAHESPNLESRVVPFAPGGWPAQVALQTYAHEADPEDIQALIRMYAEAGKRARDAGFDIVYIYGSHRALPIQFLSKRTNRRQDRYGGSFANRARFWIDSLAALKEAIGESCAVAARLAVDQLLGPEGVELEEGLKFVELAEGEGLVDLWDVNITQYMEWGEDAGPSRFYKANHQAPWVAPVKGVAKMPVVCVGRLTSPDDMLQVLASGQADIIGAARPSISDPFLPKKIEEGRFEDIRECIGCNVCISRWERGARMVCTQNATANEEYRRAWHPERFEKTKDACAVLVVGAGPAGMECARVLGEGGFEVHLREAEPELGGHLRDVVRYPGLAEWGRVTTYREIQLAKLKNVEVHTGVGPMTAEDVLGYGADKVVIATGARWAADGLSAVTLKPLPGADASLPQILTPEQVMHGKEVGERVAVLDADGYFTGIAMAEMMADLGKEVSVITQFDAVAPMTEFTLEKPNLHRMMEEKDIARRTASWVDAIETGNVAKLAVYSVWRDGYRRADGPTPGALPRRVGTEAETIECDSVILVTARLPNRELFDELKRRGERWQKEGIRGIYQAGDCYAPRMIADAVFDGHRLAREFDSPDPQRPLPYRRERAVWTEETNPKP